MLANRTTLLDSNAGAPIHPFVVEALSAFLNQSTYLGNPSSLHSFGREASNAVATARSAVLKTFRADPALWNVTFVSGGTEANQLGIRGVLETALDLFREGNGPQPRWLVSPTEHACVLDLIEPMRRAGVQVTLLSVKKNGEVHVTEEEAQTSTLISIIGVNNETGRAQSAFLKGDITSHILGERNQPTSAVLQTDYVAGWGKVPLDLSRAGAPDLVAIAGHKLGALSGVGALVHRKKIKLAPLLLGSQQNGLRGGTENLLGILSLRTLSDRWEEVSGGIQKLSALRDRFERELVARIPRAVITHSSEDRAPHLTHFSLPALQKSLSLVQQLDLRGYALSSGSACASHTVEPSHVLLALGFNKTDALNSLRVSLHPGNSWEDLNGLLEALETILKRNEIV